MRDVSESEGRLLKGLFPKTHSVARTGQPKKDNKEAQKSLGASSVCVWGVSGRLAVMQLITRAN